MPILATLLRSLTGAPDASAHKATADGESNVPAPQQQQQRGAPQPAAPGLELEPRPYTPILSRRSFRQLGLYFGGASFMAFSILISRRAAIRHQLRARLRYFTPNPVMAAVGKKGGEQAAAESGKEPLMALEALNLATINVTSFAIMLAGGVSWALDVSSMDDLRWWARRSMAGAHGHLDEESERELAEWVTKTLGMSIPTAEGEARPEDDKPKTA